MIPIMLYKETWHLKMGLPYIPYKVGYVRHNVGYQQTAKTSQSSYNQKHTYLYLDVVRST